MQTEACIIVLAAGSGSRFRGKGHKLAQSLASDSVLGLTLAHALATQLPVVVVVTEALAPLARTLVAARDVVVMPEVGSQPGLGMGTSIAAGVGARPQADGWLVLPGDMPLVRPATLLAVARELPCHAIVYAQRAGRRGHPVGFSAELFSELTQLSGDEGARRLVASYPAHGVEVDDPGVLIDVDTVEDVVRLRRQFDQLESAPLLAGPAADGGRAA